MENHTTSEELFEPKIPKLKKLIEEDEESLRGEISKLSLPSDVKKLKTSCKDFINKHTDTYKNQISLPNQDIISPILQGVVALYESDIELSEKISEQHRQRIQSQHRIQEIEKSAFIERFGRVLMGAFMAFLLTIFWKPTSWFVILAGCVTSALITRALHGSHIDGNRYITVRNEDIASSYKEYQLTQDDTKVVLDALRTAGECIDKVLDTYHYHLTIQKDKFNRELESCALEHKYSTLLQCHQELLKKLYTMAKSPTVDECVEQIKQSLQMYGFDAIEYEGEFHDYFDTWDKELSDFKTVKPAIVKISKNEKTQETIKKTLVLKGQVYTPKAQ